MLGCSKLQGCLRKEFILQKILEEEEKLAKLPFLQEAQLNGQHRFMDR